MFHSWNIHSWVFPVIVVHCYVADSGSSPLCEVDEFYDKVFEACSQCSDVCLPIETELCRTKCSRFNKILSSSLQSASSSSATTAAHDDHLTTIAIAVVCVVVMLVTVATGVAICILRNRKQVSRDQRRTNVNTNLEMTSRSLMTSSDQSTSQRTETLHDYTQLTTPSQNGSGIPRHDQSAVQVEDIKSSLCSADSV